MVVGICDWGIGGVGLYQLLRERSNLDVVYFSDTGFTPYGKVPEFALKQRVLMVFEHFNKIGIEKIMVACNAASTVLEEDKNIIGVIEHGVNLVVKQNIQELGLVGGKRTIDSEIYKMKLELKGLTVHQRVAQPLSARIEAGDINSDGLRKDIEQIFEPIKEMSHILLACTHYPLIGDRIAEYTGNTIFLDPAVEMCNWVLQNWDISDGMGNVSWQTTGDSLQMKNSLEKLYHIKADSIEKIKL